jgi:CHAT domain-containing protein/predicted negative regulator of RcsB-dependent stress response
MRDILSDDDSSLLSICALLRWFDRDLIRALTSQKDAGIEALLASDQVIPAAEPADAYQLRGDIRAEALARLRAERPSDESTLHRRIFEHFLHRIQEARPDDRHTADEDSVLHHLSELFLLIAARQEWHLLAELVADTRTTSLQHMRTEQWLSFYEGFVLIRTQDLDHGEAILMQLLGRPDLESQLRMQVLNALGQVCWFQTRYDRALAFWQEAYRLARETDDLLYQGSALLNMSIVYEALDYCQQALDLGTQGLQILREIRDSYRESHALYHVGKYAMRLGRWQIAQSHFHEAIALYEALGIQAGLAYLYWGQGFLHHMLGDEAQSETAYVRALEISRSQEDGQPELVLDIHFQLGFLYQTQGRWAEALAAYDRASALARQLRNQYSASFIHFRRGNIFERQGRPDEALAAYAQAIARIEAMRGATEAEEIKIGLLGTAQQVYEAIVLLCLAQGQPDEAFEYVERARSRAFLDILVKRSPELYDAADQPVATLAEVQARLPADALLVEYFTTGVLPRGESLINKLPPENARLREHLALPPQTIIFAVTHERLEVIRPLLDPNTLRPQPGDPGPGRRLLRDRLLIHLHEQLIAPVESLLPGRRLLYLIPHGPLHYVPFLALRSSAAQHLLQADGPAIALAPSATILLRNCLGRPASQGQQLYALGYNDEDKEALRYAEAEARHVAELAGGDAWAGSESKSQRLFDAGRRARWLHIAGHALYDPHDPLSSHLRLGAGDTLSARTIMSRLDLDADLVTLSACTSGLTHVVAGDELLGLQRAFLYAGARAVVCTLWEAADFVALLVMDRFYDGLRRGGSPAAALRDAQVAVRSMTGGDVLAVLERWRLEHPAFVAALGELPDVPYDARDSAIYADPFYWAPFMLIGRPD